MSMTTMRAAAGSHSPAGLAATEEPTVLLSFHSIYNDYFDFVWTCARRLGVPTDAIDDVVQEVFLTVQTRLHTLERPASLRSWLYSVVRRTVSTYHRERHTRTARESTAPPPDEGANPIQPSPLDLALLSEELKRLWRLLGELDATKREVLVRAELEEMTGSAAVAHVRACWLHKLIHP
jgi:RNA polymerase sigma-70 factor (ECF subfamily)